MQQPEDDKTIDLLAPLGLKTPRRPAKPKSQEQQRQEAAQRQEARRARLRAAGKGFISAVVDTSIIEGIDKLHDESRVDKNIIIEELLRLGLAARTG